MSITQASIDQLFNNLSVSESPSADAPTLHGKASASVSAPSAQDHTRRSNIQRILGLSVPVTAVLAIWGHLWSKLLINVCTNCFGALTGQVFGEFTRDRVNRMLLSALYTESYDVAVKQGVNLVKLVGLLDPTSIGGCD